MRTKPSLFRTFRWNALCPDLQEKKNQTVPLFAKDKDALQSSEAAFQAPGDEEQQVQVFFIWQSAIDSEWFDTGQEWAKVLI